MSARLAYPLFFFFLSSHVKGDFFLDGKKIDGLMVLGFFALAENFNKEIRIDWD